MQHRVGLLLGQLVGGLVVWLAGLLVGRSVGGLVVWLVGLLAGRSVGGLVVWLVGWLVWSVSKSFGRLYSQLVDYLLC